MYFGSMKTVSVVFVISVWAKITTGHVSLQTSFSSSQNTENILDTNSYYGAKNYNLTEPNPPSNPELTGKLSATPAPTEALDPFEVFNNFLNKHCDVRDTRLVCNAQTTFQDSVECIPLGVDNLTFAGNQSKLYNLTEAVFASGKSFSCFGGPLLLGGLLPNLKCLNISNATPEALDILIEAVTISRKLDHLTRLTLTLNHHLDQEQLSQVFSPNDATERHREARSCLPNLRKLDLSGNNFIRFNLTPYFQIPHIILNECPNLKLITVEGVTSRNRIFALETLSLSNNPELETISPWIIPSSPKLASLDLSSNPQLRVFPTSFFSRSLLDHVNFHNSSFVCDCNIKKYEAKFFLHLLQKDCVDSTSLQILQTKQFLASSCSNNRSSQTFTARNSNVSAFVDSDVVINCPISSSSRGEFSVKTNVEQGMNGNDEPIATHIAWITPTNNILVWIRQFTPSGLQHSIIEREESNGTITTKKIISNEEELESSVQVYRYFNSTRMPRSGLLFLR